MPATLTLQYHFTDFGAFQPYVGAGVNYTFFYHHQAGSADALKVKPTSGAAMQVGFDNMVDQHWGVNLDVKRLYLKPNFDVTVNGKMQTESCAPSLAHRRRSHLPLLIPKGKGGLLIADLK
ncbi:hypothetical protein MesoLj131a_61730 [Mesorhizobium sp. 131-2-1]|nr:hypothetical protein MesoLj131a_61730 [Mesorhizobium sp. 131-2-1]BCH04380.1 hypothetical protein MesoLj131b_63790 [Mesorhizobium sp. 131-2-5]